MRLEKNGRSIVGKIQMITLLLRKKKKDRRSLGPISTHKHELHCLWLPLSVASKASMSSSCFRVRSVSSRCIRDKCQKSASTLREWLISTHQGTSKGSSICFAHVGWKVINTGSIRSLAVTMLHLLHLLSSSCARSVSQANNTTFQQRR